MSDEDSGFGIGMFHGEPQNYPTSEETSQMISERTGEKLVLCDCGHYCLPINVMNASFGRVCPDCYDDYSD